MEAVHERILNACQNVTEMRRLWNVLDYNGNGVVSVAELVRFCEMEFPELNHQRALIRAFYLTTLAEGDKDEWIERYEFPALLRNIFYFNMLFREFEKFDKDDDHRLDIDEFVVATQAMGISLTREQAEIKFDLADADHGGQVLFDEFCRFIAMEKMPIAGEVHEDFTMAEVHHRNKSSKAAGSKQAGYDNQPDIHSRKFAKVEKRIKQVLASPKQLSATWHSLDYDNNLIVSLAEVDKFIIETYPILNHKHALMRAYKATTLLDGDGDDWIERPELPDLLRNILYFNKLEAVFNYIDKDHDHRLDFDEFVQSLGAIGLALPMEEAQQEFELMDSNHGGKVLFDEFCAWAARKACPVDGHVRSDYVLSNNAAPRHHRSAAEASADERRRIAEKRRQRQKTTAKTKYGKVEAKLKAIVEHPTKLKQMFRRLDRSADGSVSLHELHTYLADKYPILSRKPALKRAHEHVGGGDGISLEQLPSLLQAVVFFHNALDVFDAFDSSGDHKLSFDEFSQGVATLGISKDESEIKAEFDALDGNGGGDISLNEFIEFVVKYGVSM